MTDDEEVEGLLRRMRPTQDEVDAASVLARVRRRLVGADTKLPHVGRFEILARLGAGGMGVVYEARDPRLARHVALKLIPGVSEADGERVLAEARALAQLNHPHVVVVYEAEVVGGQLLIAMELVRGSTLTRWNATARSMREVVRAFIAAGEGLAAAHKAGLIHGDFKPDNVLVGNDGRVRVADFGLARQRDRVGVLGASHERGGTPSYASPEQLAGQDATESSDQYAFGKALARMLGDDPRHGAPWLRRIVARTTAALPEARYAGMPDVVAALQAGLERRTRLVAAASLFGALVVGAGAMFGVYGRAATSCARNAEELSRIWNPELAAQLRAGFAATHLPFAATVADSVVARLDVLGGEWKSASRAVCEAARVDGNRASGLVEIRAACVDDRRRTIGALVSAWTQHPDGTAVTRAIDALGDVPAIPDCADPSRTGLADREPADPARRARWRELRGRLAVAREAVALGRTEVPEIDAVATDARALGFQPLVADALELEARLAYEREDDDRDKSVRTALALAAEVGDAAAVAREDILLLEMYIDSDREQDRDAATDMDTLVSAAAHLARRPELEVRFGAAKSRLSGQQGRYDRARTEGTAALALLRDLRAASHDPALLLDVESEVRLNFATMDQRQERFADGLADVDEAIAARTAIYGTAEHPSLAPLFVQKAGLQRKLGDRPGAIASAQTALKLADASAPHYADEAANAADILSYVSGDAGNLEDGLEYARIAVQRSIDRYGPTDAVVGRRKARLASALLDMNQLAAARVQIDEAIAISKKRKDDPSRLADAVNTLGGILEQSGDPAGAEKAYRESLALAESVGHDSAKAAVALSNIGQLAIEQHHFAEAADVCERALAIDTKTFGAKHPDLAFDLTCLGKAHVGVGDARAAREVFERAWTLRTANPVALGDRADTAFALARVLDDHARAKKLATDAERWFREGHKDKDSAEVRAWLAKHP